MNSIDFVETYSAIILKKHKDKKTQERYYTVSLVKRTPNERGESEIKRFKTYKNSPMLSYYFAVIFETFFSVYLPSIYENKLDAAKIIDTFTKPDGKIKGYTINHLYGLEYVLNLFVTINVHFQFIYNKNGFMIWAIK